MGAFSVWVASEICAKLRSVWADLYGFEAGMQFKGEHFAFGRLDLDRCNNPSALNPDGVLSLEKTEQGPQAA